MSTPRTTGERLVAIYDKTIDYLEAKLDAGALTTGDLGELRKLLDAATVLSLVKASASASPHAVPVAALPFPGEIDLSGQPPMRACP